MKEGRKGEVVKEWRGVREGRKGRDKRRTESYLDGSGGKVWPMAPESLEK